MGQHVWLPTRNQVCSLVRNTKEELMSTKLFITVVQTETLFTFSINCLNSRTVSCGCDFFYLANQLYELFAGFIRYLVQYWCSLEANVQLFRSVYLEGEFVSN